MIPHYTDDHALVFCADVLEFLREWPADSVDLCLTDPPYLGVIDVDWDNAWPTPEAFLSWLAEVADEIQRILRPAGSLYLFASVEMAARVEVEVIRQRFNVLNRIRWHKLSADGQGERNNRMRKEDLTSFWPLSEEVLFAEQRYSAGADREAILAVDAVRAEVFRPLIDYFQRARRESGLTSEQIREHMFERTGARWMFDRHTFSDSQWHLPTREQYEAAQELFNNLDRDYAGLDREYQGLYRDYEELRAEYEQRRRPFRVTKHDQWRDVWSFSPLEPYRGKHPCEKPPAMAEHIVRVSGRPGGVLLDPFAGSGAFLAAGKAAGMTAIGCDASEKWCDHAAAKLRATEAESQPIAAKRWEPGQRPSQRQLFGRQTKGAPASKDGGNPEPLSPPQERSKG